jgi:hypothetical protein
VLAQESVPAQRLAAGRVRGAIDDLELRIDAVEPAVALQALRGGSQRAWTVVQRTFGTFPESAASEQSGHGTGADKRDPHDAQETN